MFCLVQFTIYGIFEMQWFIPHGLSRNAQTMALSLKVKDVSLKVYKGLWIWIGVGRGVDYFYEILSEICLRCSKMSIKRY